MIPIIVGVAFLTFILFTYFGEDPVRVALGQHATQESIEELRALWGLDQPLYIQFWDFLIQIISFDFGQSYTTGESLADIFREGALVSLKLTVPPFFIGIVINIAISLMISYWRDSVLDHASRFIFIFSMSISYLIYIILFQYLLAYKLEWFPIQGYEEGFAGLMYFVLPWIIIIIVSMGPDIRIFRTIFLDQTKADYCRTAKAKGAGNNRILFVHVLKNAMIPILTHTVVAIPFLITGAFVMERYFGIPGIGDVTITAINEGDFPILKGVTIVMAILYALFNLITDVLYAFFDPRVTLD